jgi:AraC-like DNA-binding protein
VTMPRRPTASRCAVPRRVHLSTIGVHRCEPCWRLGPERTRMWNDLDLWLLLEGEGRVETPEGTYELGPGSCLILRGGEPYTFQQNPRHRFRHWFAHFSIHDGASTSLSPQTDAFPRYRRLDGHLLLVGLLERARDAHVAGDLSCHRWMEAALLEVERCDVQLALPADPWRRQIAELVERLRSDPASAPTVAAMARSLSVGQDRFARLFRARTGLSPRAFMVQTRLDHARVLLAESLLSIREIAEACGYSDPSFFCRQFVGHNGRSPGSWRKWRTHSAQRP